VTEGRTDSDWCLEVDRVGRFCGLNRVASRFSRNERRLVANTATRVRFGGVGGFHPPKQIANPPV